jgi:succinate dehydrogenase/fumarate reductase flavoprotein subunit
MPDYDVVVAGAGAAGLCASLAAAEAGASVLLTEAEAVPGGASRFAAGLIMAAGTSFQAQRGIQDDADALFHEYMSFNQWNVEPGVARALADNAGPAVDWLAGHGLGFTDVYFSGDDRVPRGHVAAGGGQGIVDCLLSAVRAHERVDLAYGRRADRLLTADGAVTGLAADGDVVTAASVVLATGGFGANRSLWPRYLPRAVAAEWSFYIGPPSSRGDAFALARQAGAQIAGTDRGLINARPHFSQSMDSYYPGWLVFVDSSGHRFVNEQAAYSVIEATFRARGGRAWAVFDDAAKRAAVPRSTAAAKKYDMPTGSNWEDWIEPVIEEMAAKGIVLVADTLRELAALAGIPPRALEGQLARYNDDVLAGRDTMFGKAANVLRAVAEPPFYVTEMRLCNVSLTGCGPRIDPEGRVLDEATRVIPGLYAAGECAGGVLGDVYMGSGNALASAVTFGRVAGTSAARRALAERLSPLAWMRGRSHALLPEVRPAGARLRAAA